MPRPIPKAEDEEEDAMMGRIATGFRSLGVVRYAYILYVESYAAYTMSLGTHEPDMFGI